MFCTTVDTIFSYFIYRINLTLLALFFNKNADKSVLNLREGYHQLINNNKFNRMQTRIDSNSLHDQVFLEGKFANNDKNYAYSANNNNNNIYSRDLPYYNSNPSDDSADNQESNVNEEQVTDTNALIAKGENINEYFYQNNFSNNYNQQGNYLNKNLRNNNLIAANNNQLNYPYPIKSYLYTPYPNANTINNINNINNNNNLVDIKSNLENTEQYGENLAKGFFDDSHLNFFSGFRFKEKNKESEKQKEKEKEKEKSKKQLLKEKLRTSFQDKKIRNHPCFNKGYFNKDLNFTGRGNFTDCYKFIGKLILKEDLEKASAKINKNRNLFGVKKRNSTIEAKNRSLTNQLNHTNAENSNLVYLDNQFKNFKFLFYEKNGTDSVLVFKEKMQYGLLKQKVRNICEEQYLDVIADFTKFNIK